MNISLRNIRHIILLNVKVVSECHGVKVKPVHPLGFGINPEGDPDVNLIQEFKNILPAIVSGLIASNNIHKLIGSAVNQLPESRIGQ